MKIFLQHPLLFTGYVQETSTESRPPGALPGGGGGAAGIWMRSGNPGNSGGRMSYGISSSEANE